MTDTPAIIPATKVCTKCGIEKTIDNFYRLKKSEPKVSCVCKKCHKADIKAWRLQNRDIVAKKSRERYAQKTEEQKELRRKRVREWYAKNKTRYNTGRRWPTDDYSDLVPITRRHVGFRAWAVITSYEYAKELTLWQNADMMEEEDGER